MSLKDHLLSDPVEIFKYLLIYSSNLINLS